MCVSFPAIQSGLLIMRLGYVSPTPGGSGKQLPHAVLLHRTSFGVLCSLLCVTSVTQSASCSPACPRLSIHTRERHLLSRREIRVVVVILISLSRIR